MEEASVSEPRPQTKKTKMYRSDSDEMREHADEIHQMVDPELRKNKQIKEMPHPLFAHI